jgi:hypothetical protein
MALVIVVKIFKRAGCQRSQATRKDSKLHNALVRIKFSANSINTNKMDNGSHFMAEKLIFIK